jgi:DNA-binding response OmpR family regulator
MGGTRIELCYRDAWVLCKSEGRNKAPMASEILLVEDDLESRDVITIWLELEGYRISAVSDGQAAIDACFQHPPDLIIVDLVMSNLDRLQTIRLMRAYSSTSTKPIIAVTDDRTALGVAALEAGADRVLRKPFDLETLVTIVRSLLVTRDPYRKVRASSRGRSVRPIS